MKDNLERNLCNAVLSFPQLIDDFPSMLAALDQGEVVNIDGISNPGMRNALTEIMSELPLEYAKGEGYFKSSSIISVGGFLLMDLVSKGIIKQPTGLNETEQLSSRLAPLHLLGLLKKYPALKDDLISILDNIMDGGAVDLNGLEDEDIGIAIDTWLTCLGVVECDDGHSIPTGSSYGKVYDSLRMIHLALCSDEDSLNDDDSSVESKNSRKRLKSNSVQSTKKHKSGNHESSEEKDKLYSDDKHDLVPMTTDNSTKNKDKFIIERKKGGEMDTCNEDGEEEEEDDDDDDDVGPLPANHPLMLKRLETKRNIQKVETSSKNLPLGLEVNNPSFDSELPSDLSKIDHSNREEWMLTPGNSKAMASIEDTFGKERKFNIGKGATKTAKEVAMKNKHQEENPERLAAMEEYKKLRGPSLMELHIQQKDTKKTEGKSKFDYSRDITSHRGKVDQAVRAKMIKEANELDSKFDKVLSQNGK